MKAVRICMRIADSLSGPTAGSVKDACGRCQLAVWVDVAQVVPAEPDEWEHVCLRCVIADPTLTASLAPRDRRAAIAVLAAADGRFQPVL